MALYSEGTTDFSSMLLSTSLCRLLATSQICSLSFVSSWPASEVTHLTSLFCNVGTSELFTCAFPRELLLHIGYNVLKNVIDINQRILHILESVSSQQLQNCALQLLFDVKFLSNLLPHSSILAAQEVV